MHHRLYLLDGTAEVRQSLKQMCVWDETSMLPLCSLQLVSHESLGSIAVPAPSHSAARAGVPGIPGALLRAHHVYGLPVRPGRGPLSAAAGQLWAVDRAAPGAAQARRLGYVRVQGSEINIP